MSDSINQGDMFTVDTTNDDQTQFYMQGAHDRYKGRMDVFAVDGDTATVHCRIEYWDDRNPRETSNVTERTFDTPVAAVTAVGGHKWVKYAR